MKISTFYLGRISLVLALLCSGWLLDPGISLGASGQPEIAAPVPQPATNEFLVGFAQEVGREQAREELAQAGLRVIRSLPAINAWQVAAPEAQTATLRYRLLVDPAVRWVESNGLVYAQEITPDDNFYLSQQENLRVIGMPQAWEYTTGEPVIIAVIDSGIDLDHPDLAAKLWHNPAEVPENGLDDDLNGFVDDVWGWDFVNTDGLPQDDMGHGSHVAGIAAAASNNGIGIAGVSWGANLMAVKVLNRVGDGTFMDAAAGIVYAADQGAAVLNLSFGTAEYSQVIADAVAYTRDQGALVVASAGNGGLDVFYPAALPGVLAVGATDNLDVPWVFTNRGLALDLVAPGVNILSANASGSYFQQTGTSMSAPHVSGVASLVWSLRSDWPAALVADNLAATAEDIWMPGFDTLTGWGRLDAAAALVEASRRRIYLPQLPSEPVKRIHTHRFPQNYVNLTRY